MPRNRRAFRPDDIFGIRWVSDPQISSDGHNIACVVTQMDGKADEYHAQVWLVPTSRRGRPRQSTFGSKRDFFPRWSPNGRTLAFISDRGGKGQVWLMQTDGGEARQLTDLPGGVSYLAWSPDSRRLAVVSLMGDEEQKPKIREITSLKYKMDGEGFRDGRKHVFVVEVESGRTKQITDGDWDDTYPCWSPDGKRIAFASARHDTRDIDSIADIWAVSAAGGEPRRVTASTGPATMPVWSPDGNASAYLGHDDPHANLAKNYGVWLVDAEGGTPRNLSAKLDRCGVTPGAGSYYLTLAWTPEGDGMLLLAMHKGNVHLYRVPRNGGAVDLLISGDRQLSQFSVARDGRVAYTASDPVNPAEVFVFDEEGNERQLTDFNRAFKNAVELQRPERVALRSYDGLEIEGWVMRPYGFEPERKYPALVNIHGGPHAQYGNVFFDEFQVQAGAGYVVFFLNPRGSQGYGQEFASAVCGDWGGKDYEDVMAGVDWLVRQEYVDPERLGILGGSYGGYMTSWVVGHTERFRAACSERAVNNLHSMYGTSDIGNWFQEFEIGGTPWGDTQYYLERSPIAYVKKIRTPLLILHSERDLRCPMEQAEQLFVAVKKLRQTDVSFIRFPDESHELSRNGKPSRRVARFGYILGWFDKYLRPHERQGANVAGEATVNR